MSDLLTVAEVAAETRHCTATVRHWITAGVMVGGSRVKLDGRRVGGRFLVARDALDRFLSECNPGAAPARPNPATAAGRFARERASVLRRLNGGAA